MNTTRINGKKIDLEYDKIFDFFQQRSLVKSESNPYVSVIYQDKSSDVAIYRDKYEKNIITPLLTLEKHHNILDIGCGIGRWAETVSDKVGTYLGVDFSEKFIETAQTRLATKNNIDLKILAAQKISAETLLLENYFHRIIISGVLIYLNDDEVVECFRNILSLVTSDAILYIREPLSLTSRLTLNGFWSTEMEQYYYGIYRTKKELSTLIHQGLGFNTNLTFKPLYKENIGNNRKETAQFYDVLRIYQ